MLLRQRRLESAHYMSHHDRQGAIGPRQIPDLEMVSRTRRLSGEPLRPVVELPIPFIYRRIRVDCAGAAAGLPRNTHTSQEQNSITRQSNLRFRFFIIGEPHSYVAQFSPALPRHFGAPGIASAASTFTIRAPADAHNWSSCWARVRQAGVPCCAWARSPDARLNLRSPDHPWVPLPAGPRSLFGLGGGHPRSNHCCITAAENR